MIPCLKGLGVFSASHDKSLEIHWLTTSGLWNSSTWWCNSPAHYYQVPLHFAQQRYTPWRLVWCQRQIKWLFMNTINAGNHYGQTFLSVKKNPSGMPITLCWVGQFFRTGRVRGNINNFNWDPVNLPHQKSVIVQVVYFVFAVCADAWQSCHDSVHACQGGSVIV